MRYILTNLPTENGIFWTMVRVPLMTRDLGGKDWRAEKDSSNNWTLRSDGLRSRMTFFEKKLK
jgi:hypothetical protein